MNVDIQPLKVEVGAEGGPRTLVEEGHGYQIPTPARQSLDGAGIHVIGVDVLHPNAELLEGYLSVRRLSPNTGASYGTALRSFTNLVGAPLVRAGRAEFEEWFRRVDALGLAASTIVLYTSRLRNLLVHALTRQGNSKVAARARALISLEGVPLPDLHREAKIYGGWVDKLLTPVELGVLLREAVHPRARALLPVAYETACRKGELIGARVRDVAIGRDYSEIRVVGKTGLRTLPLVRSVPALESWLDAHPDPSPRSPLFATVVDGEMRRMSDRTPNKLMAGLSERGGIRHTHPHMLRHTRLTELAAAGVGEYVLKSFAGWTQDSDMASRYVHFSGRTHIPAILRLEGIDVDPSRRGGPTSVADVYGALGRVLAEARA